jgi:hypothetical protein
MKAMTDIPLVWHFKESPQEALKAGLWDKLTDLYAYADGKIYLSEYSKQWFEQFIPTGNMPTFIMDTELPKNNCFTDNFSSKLSDTDGAIHTVIPGRVTGLTRIEMMELAKQDIHIYNQSVFAGLLAREFRFLISAMRQKK